jgi:DNA-binding Lrp family transcriptional regulator
VVIAFILVNTVPGKETEVYKKLSGMENVSEIYTLFGEYDLIVKVETKDFSQLERIVIDHIRSIPGIVDTKTLTGIKF